MKKNEIKVGRHYRAKVSGKLTTVRVEEIGKKEKTKYSRGGTYYVCTNLATKRKVNFKSAMKFRGLALNEDILKDSPKPQPVAKRKNVEVFVKGEFPPVKPQPSLSERLRKQQDHPVDNAPHLIVRARAGTGKTTTLIEGLKILKGDTSQFTPSPQQKKVWDSIGLSKNARSVCFVAFNKSIATELQSRVPMGCDAMTMHSMGFKAVKSAFGLTFKDINKDRVQNIICGILQRDIREIRKYKMELLKATQRLVSLCKMNLVSDANGPWGWNGELDKLCSHYDVELNGNRGEVFELVPKVLDRCKDVNRDRQLDFDDMIWLPVALGLRVFQYDLLLVDEAQDLNRCQQQLAMMAGKRLILCGDDKQAIYGFAGADAESLNRLFTILQKTKLGCENLPLTVTRRCGKAIVKEAQKYVPDFEAHETCPEGVIKRKGMKPAPEGSSTERLAADYRQWVIAGDMILCRVNAPLVSECFKFIRVGRKANIQGRDIGRGLISTVKKMKAANVPDLIGRLSDWLHREQSKENQKRIPSDSRLIALQDRYDCLECFCEGRDTIAEVITRIETIFTDDKTVPGIRLSSIHKSKGLEANRVFLINNKDAPCPHPMAKTKWAKEQELNLLYVAITRAIKELVYVS